MDNQTLSELNIPTAAQYRLGYSYGSTINLTLKAKEMIVNQIIPAIERKNPFSLQFSDNRYVTLRVNHYPAEHLVDEITRLMTPQPFGYQVELGDDGCGQYATVTVSW